MVIVELKDNKINYEERLIANALVDCINDDVKMLQCNCNTNSKLYVIVDKNKINAIRTEINACCNGFKEEIEEALFAVSV